MTNQMAFLLLKILMETQRGKEKEKERSGAFAFFSVKTKIQEQLQIHMIMENWPFEVIPQTSSTRDLAQ